jgi:Calcineurin-like phosphoesterase
VIDQVIDRARLAAYVEALRGQLVAPQLQDAVARAAAAIPGGGDPHAQLQAALPPLQDALASSGGRDAKEVPYLARDPVQSLLQSTLEAKLLERGVPAEAPATRNPLLWLIHLLREFLHPVRFGPDDVDWVTDVAAAVLDRVARGNHPFNPAPAEREIAADARVVIVGDWGTGLPRAQKLATVMAAEVAHALAQGREAHVVHLGDVYYSGTEDEVRRHVLAPGMWPVSAQQAAAGVSSWSLNGNHDMYGGGFGYFQTLLGDPRFAGQRSPDGKPTSFFRLRSARWDLLGLDTSWDPDVLSMGFVGVLEDPQAAFAVKVARESDRRLMLLTHHQPVSVYDQVDLGPTLTEKLGAVLDGRRVSAWLWGHEHRCMGFAPSVGVRVPRCLGHGGVPVLSHGPDVPIPAPGLWEERAFVKYRGDHWGRFGCAILDFAGERIDVRYRDEHASTSRSETIA